MKKKTKIALIIIFIILLVLSLIYLVIKFDTYILKITEVEESNITGINKNNELYMFNSSDIIIKDFKKIDITELKKDEIIFILNEPPSIKTLEAYSTKYGESVERIKNIRIIIDFK